MSSFSKEIVTFHNNLHLNDSLIDMFVEIDQQKCKNGKNNKIEQYTILIDIFKEMTTT